jgi:hypothetical protein
MDTATKVALVADLSEKPELVEQRTTVGQSTVRSQAPTWLHTNLRNLIAVVLTVIVCWLALTGSHEAMTALIAAFSVLMGALWGERAALKIPGQDS